MFGQPVAACLPRRFLLLRQVSRDMLLWQTCQTKWSDSNFDLSHGLWDVRNLREIHPQPKLAFNTLPTFEKRRQQLLPHAWSWLGHNCTLPPTTSFGTIYFSSLKALTQTALHVICVFPPSVEEAFVPRIDDLFENWASTSTLQHIVHGPMEVFHARISYPCRTIVALRNYYARPRAVVFFWFNLGVNEEGIFYLRWWFEFIKDETRVKDALKYTFEPDTCMLFAWRYTPPATSKPPQSPSSLFLEPNNASWYLIFTNSKRLWWVSEIKCKIRGIYVESLHEFSPSSHLILDENCCLIP